MRGTCRSYNCVKKPFSLEKRAMSEITCMGVLILKDGYKMVLCYTLCMLCNVGHEVKLFSEGSCSHRYLAKLQNTHFL